MNYSEKYGYTPDRDAIGRAIHHIGNVHKYAREEDRPSKTLFIITALGGGIGTIAGMYTFRHKTKHLKFTLGFPIIFLFQLISIFLFLNSNFSIKLFY